jgi:Tfp pilus assembly protein PilZ
MLTPKTKLEGEIENVSSKGAFISCRDMPPLEGHFFIVIETPKYKTMSITGKVVWSTVIEAHKGDPRIGVGIQFTNMSRTDRQFIHKVIAKQYEMKTGRKLDKT